MRLLQHTAQALICFLLGSCITAPPQAPPAAAGPAAATAPPSEVALTTPPQEPTASSGTPYTWKNVTILGGGFVTGVIFSPAVASLTYARTDVGGAYRYDSAAQNWIPLTDMLGRDDSNLVGIESIAADPVDPNKVYLAAGTYVQDWAGKGAILRSNDQGRSWKRTDMPIKMGGNENGRSNGERLAVDPRAPNVLFFGSRKNGLWKSTDAAATWNRVESFPAFDDGKGMGIGFVVFDPKSGAAGKPTPTIYAGVANPAGSLYRSLDGGSSWQPVPRQPTKLFPSHASFDASGTLYVTYANGPGPNDISDGAVWKFDPKQGVFTNISPATPGGDDKFGYGGLAVDAARSGTVLVTTLDRWTKGDEIFRTTDSGKRWVALREKASRDVAGAQYLFFGKEKLGPPHWMGDIDLDPFRPGHAWFVTGDGVWESEDITAADTGNPTHWAFRDHGLEETVVDALVSPPVGPALLTGVGDICGFRHDDLGIAPARGAYSNPSCNAAHSIDIAGGHPEMVVRVGTSWGEPKHGALSTDSGTTWAPFANEPRGAERGGLIAISADGASILWSIKNGAPAYSTDQGTTWGKVEGLSEPASLPDWVGASLRPSADRVNAKKLYVYDVARGQVFASNDGGPHFGTLSVHLPTIRADEMRSASIETAPGIEGDIWITTSKQVFHSTDSGKTFSPLRSVEEGHGLAFGKSAPGRGYPALYLIGKVKGANGFFRSDDAGATWIRVNDDAHQFGAPSVIAGDPRVFGRVYIGTGGRGILYGEPTP